MSQSTPRAIDASLFPAKGPALRGLRKTRALSARRPEVFRAWTTAEGLSSFLDSPVIAELCIGGPLEVHFLEDAPEGARGSEGCQYLAYLPDELVCFSWNAPPHLPGPRAQRAWVVIRLSDREGGGTELALDHVGFGEGAEWDAAFAYFDAAWERVLDRLASRLEGS